MRLYISLLARLVYLVFAILPLVRTFQLYVPSDANIAGQTIFTASPLSHRFRWSLKSREHEHLSRWLNVQPEDGQVTLKNSLRCEASHVHEIVPRPLQFSLLGQKVALEADSAEGLQSLEIPLTIFFEHRTCDLLLPSTFRQSEHAQAILFKQLNAFYPNHIQHHSSFAQVHHLSTSALPESLLIAASHSSVPLKVNVAANALMGCVKSSQFLWSLQELLPTSIDEQQCDVQYYALSSDWEKNENELHFNGQPADLSPPNFGVQKNGDLIALSESCPTPTEYMAKILLHVQCDWKNNANKVMMISSQQPLHIRFQQNVPLTQKYIQPILHRYKRELQAHARSSSGLYFERSLYIVKVAEEQEPGQLVTSLTASSSSGIIAPIHYEMHAILDARSQSLFRIEPSTGQIYTTGRLDREQMNVHYFKVSASQPAIGSHPAASVHITLQINVLDINDHSPAFEQQLYEQSLSEALLPGSVVGTLRASDADSGENAALEYSIDQVTGCYSNETFDEINPCNKANDLFQINPTTGALSTRGTLDREICPCYALKVRVSDQAGGSVSERRHGWTQVQIRIQDENDNYPQFERRSYTVKVREDIDTAKRPAIIQVRATDADENLNALIRYSIIAGNHQHQFSINPSNGELQAVKPLDYEQERSYQLIIRAQDAGAPPKANTTQVLILVQDVNDNQPLFYSGLVAQNVPEDVKIGEPIVRLQAFDADDGPNGRLFYALKQSGQASISLDQQRAYEKLATQILSNNNSDMESNESSGEKEESDFPFSIDSSTGWLTCVRPLDYEKESSYEFQVLARDFGQPFRQSALTVRLRILDVNDNTPQFSQSEYKVTISELTRIGGELLRLRATDADQGSRLAFSIVSGNEEGRFSILQTGSGTAIGNGIVPVSDTMTSSGNEALLTLVAPLDYRRARDYTLRVQVQDMGGLSDFANIIINVTDANTHRPVIKRILPSGSPVQLPEDTSVGSVVAIIEASDADSGENARLSYQLVHMLGKELIGEASIEQTNASDLPFTINPSTGVISLATPLDRERIAGYNLLVQVSDHGEPPLSDSTSVDIELIDVNDNAPVFEQSRYHGSLSELAAPGTGILNVKATDLDIALNGQLKYQLLDVSGELPSELRNMSSPPTKYSFGDLQGYFSVDSLSGLVRTARMLDRETLGSFKLVIAAIDRGQPSLTGTTEVLIDLQDANDNPPRFPTEKFVFYVPENSPLGTSVGLIHAEDADIGENAIISYELVGGSDASWFRLVERRQENACELLTSGELDFESDRKVFKVTVRASSPPLRNDVEVEIFITDVNDNAPTLSDFTIVFNNFRNHFPLGSIGRVPAYDIDVSDHLRYQFTSGNRANLLLLNESSGEISLSPYLNSNVPTRAQFDLTVSDGLNEASGRLFLVVNLVSDVMLANSVQMRMSAITSETLQIRYSRLIEAASALFHCSKESVVIFDFRPENEQLNITLAVRTGAEDMDQYIPSNVLRERLYLGRSLFQQITGMSLLPFEENLCTQEPCLNFEQCSSMLKFRKAASFLYAEQLLFRPIEAHDTFTCSCPVGFTGFHDPLDCDTELNFCHTSPCQNSGKCLPIENSYFCVCDAGFTGRNCEFNLDQNVDEMCEQADMCKGGSRCLSAATKRSVSKRHLLTQVNQSLFTPQANAWSSQDSSSFSSIEVIGTQSQTVHTAHLPVTTPLYCTNCSEPEWSNAFCELRARQFAPGSHLSLSPLRARNRFELSLRFATKSKDALLLSNGRLNEKGDFIALQLIDGFRLQFTYSVGGQQMNSNEQTASVEVITPANYLNDGSWHRVRILYRNRTAFLQLDDCNVALLRKHLLTLNYVQSPDPFSQIHPDMPFPVGSSRFLSFTCANFVHLPLPERCEAGHTSCPRLLELNAPLQLGGLTAKWLTERMPNAVQGSFDGCLADLTIDHKLVDLNAHVHNNASKPGCSMKRSWCHLGVCRNGGTCREVWSGFVCDCKAGFEGRSCEEKTTGVRSFSGGNSYLRFAFAGRPVALPWRLKFSFRTQLSNAMLLHARLGGLSGGGLAIYIQMGRLHVALERQVLRVSGGRRLGSGNWTHVGLHWASGGLHVQVNFGEAEARGQFEQPFQGQLISHVTLGSADTLLDNDSSTGLMSNAFEYEEPDHEQRNLLTLFNVSAISRIPALAGCIQSLDINGNQDAWLNSEDSRGVTSDCVDISHTEACSRSSCSEGAICVSNAAGGHRCECRSRSYIGPECEPICSLKPCSNGAHCILKPNTDSGFECACVGNYTGPLCEQPLPTSPPACPAGWWRPLNNKAIASTTTEQPAGGCAPCTCSTQLGHDARCAPNNGRCVCAHAHFRPSLGHLLFSVFAEQLKNSPYGSTAQGVKAYFRSEQPPLSALELLEQSPLHVQQFLRLIVLDEKLRKNLARTIFNNESIRYSLTDFMEANDLLEEILLRTPITTHLLQTKMNLDQTKLICMDCGCNPLGAYAANCTYVTGQCACKPGVLGRKCDRCASRHAQLSSFGCEVPSDSCPTSLAGGLSWPKTRFGVIARIRCSGGSLGWASRRCTEESGWSEPTLDRCLAAPLASLARQWAAASASPSPSELNDELKSNFILNGWLAAQFASDLRAALPVERAAHAAELRLAAALLGRLLVHEANSDGLNLTHTQDAKYTSNVFAVAGALLQQTQEGSWKRLEALGDQEIIPSQRKLTLRAVSENSEPDELDQLLALAGPPVKVTDLFKQVLRYASNLIKNQADTFTSPFMLSSQSLIFALDTVSESQIWTQDYSLNEEPTLLDPITGLPSIFMPVNESNEIPMQSSKRAAYVHQVYDDWTLKLPKYNNFAPPAGLSSVVSWTPLLQAGVGDNLMPPSWANIYVPLSTFQLSSEKPEGSANPSTPFAYAVFSSLGDLLPMAFESTVRNRFEVPLVVNSAVVAILLPSNEKVNEKIHLSFQLRHQAAHSNPQCVWLQFASDTSSTQGVNNAEMLLDPSVSQSANIMQEDSFSNSLENVLQSSAPTRVRWSAQGCELKDVYPKRVFSNRLLSVNCSCTLKSGGGVYAVLMDQSERLMYFELKTQWTVDFGLIFGALLLIIACLLIWWLGNTTSPNTGGSLLTGIILNGRSSMTTDSVSRGCSNSALIQRHLLLCTALIQIFFAIATHYRNDLLQIEFGCKLVALVLQYGYLASFAWLVVSSLHAYRMLSELRDVNRGPMHFYRLIGYGLPAIICAISLTLRADQYGNHLFCWLSAQESIFWSILTPLVLFSLTSMLYFIAALRSSYRIKQSQTAELRQVLWLQSLWLPLLCMHFSLAMLAANNTRDAPFQALAGLSLLTGLGWLIALWTSSPRLRLLIRRRLAAFSGMPVASVDSLTATRTSVIMQSKQHLNMGQSGEQINQAPTGLGRLLEQVNGWAGQLGSAATLPHEQSHMGQRQWSVASGMGEADIDFDGSFDGLDASTTTSTSRSTTSRHHRGTRRRRHRRTRNADDKMMDETDNYIDPRGYFSYDNDSQVGTEVSYKRRRSHSKHRRTHAKNEEYEDDQSQEASEAHYAMFSPQIMGPRNEYMNMPHVTVNPLEQVSSLSTLSRNVPTNTSIEQQDINNGFALYQVPQSLGAPVYPSGAAVHEPFNRANILSMMDANVTTSLYNQGAHYAQPINADSASINAYAFADQSMNGFASAQPRLVDYSIQDDEEASAIYAQTGYRHKDSTVSSSSHERNNEVSEFVENI